MQSIFIDKSQQPSDKDLEAALGKTYIYWKQLADYVNKSFPGATNEWHYSSEKYGWSFRISDKKRVLIYLLPRKGFFKTAFVFGQKAANKIMDSKVCEDIKDELKAAKVYAEGQGIRIEIKDSKLVEDIQKLIDIKIAY